jgi:hypothetical protein
MHEPSLLRSVDGDGTGNRLRVVGSGTIPSRMLVPVSFALTLLLPQDAAPPLPHQHDCGDAVVVCA